MISSYTMNPLIHDVIFASFAADSFSLGAHWEYDTDKIRSTFPQQLTSLHSPLSSYHAQKHAGDQTHIGDNALLFLQHLADQHSFKKSAYIQSWLAVWDVQQPPGYVDHFIQD